MDLGTTRVLYSVAEGNELLQGWLEQQTSNGPIPSSYRVAYIEPKLSELVALDADGSTTAAFILYSYYRFDKESSSYFKWRDKSAVLGFESAILEVRKSNVFQYGDKSNYQWALSVLFVLCAVAALMFFLKKKFEQ